METAAAPECVCESTHGKSPNEPPLPEKTDGMGCRFASRLDPREAFS
jgi:hypothetical protein